MVQFLPDRPCLPFRSLLRVQMLQIHLSLAGKEIHISRPYHRSFPPYFVEDVAEYNDGGREIGLEEIDDESVGGHGFPADRRKAGPELGDEDDAVKEEADPRADDADGGTPREFVKGVTL